MNSIFTRRSVRSYQNKPIEREKIEQLLRAGMQAPSAMCQLPWEFIVVTNKQALAELAKVSPYAGMLAGAACAIIVLGNEKRITSHYNWQQDTAACTQNILLEAVAQGLGACWIGIAPNEEKMQFVSELFGLGVDMHPFSVISLGYPAQENANQFVDRFDSSRVFEVK